MVMELEKIIKMIIAYQVDHVLVVQVWADDIKTLI